MYNIDESLYKKAPDVHGEAGPAGGDPGEAIGAAAKPEPRAAPSQGRTVLAVQGAHGRDDEKYVLDKEYFDQLLQRHSSLVETLEIMTDRKLFGQILAAADALEEDLRQGKLHSLEEAFKEA